MMNKGIDKDLISSAIKEFGLSIQDVMVLLNGYEKFNDSSIDEKKVMINKVVELIEQQ